MSNTIIQIKRSTTSNVPVNGSLLSAEQAYSFLSDKLFIGNSDGTGVVEIGGKYWVDTTKAAYVQANTARDHANSAFEAANTAAADASANVAAAFLQANTARTHANAAHLTANASFDNANAAFVQANTARTHANTAHLTANAAFDQANTARTHANAAHLTANAGFVQANTARDHANAAFDFANTRYSSSGGTISGDVSITGNLFVAGNVTTFTANNLIVNDPFILVANNNLGDVNDIGIAAHYNGNSHTGIFRSASTKEWYVFSEYDQHFFYNGEGNIDLSGNNFTLAVLNSYLKTTNLTLNGVNAAAWISSAFDQANTARTHANTAHLTSNAAFLQANTARTHANTAHLTANAAFDQANTARTHANTAHLTANAAFNNANAAFLQANTARTHANAAHLTANAAFDTANAAFNNANAAFLQANTAAANAVNASALSTGTVPSARMSGSYTGITGVGTLTAGTWNANIIKVPYGGTGVGSFTTNGILYGNNAGDLKVTLAGTEGQVLQASSTGVPQFGMLDGGTF